MTRSDWDRLSDEEFLSLPLVVEGVEYYLQYGARVVLVTLEDDSHSFSLDQPGFMAFLDSITVLGGE